MQYDLLGEPAASARRPALSLLAYRLVLGIICVVATAAAIAAWQPEFLEGVVAGATAGIAR